MTVRPQDLGGRHGFGPVQIEQDEPVFHADWEASVIAGILATISAGLYNVDQFREGIDELEPLSYLTLGYYRRWLHTLEVNCMQSGVFTAEELEARIQAIAPAASERRRRRTTRSPAACAISSTTARPSRARPARRRPSRSATQCAAACSRARVTPASRSTPRAGEVSSSRCIPHSPTPTGAGAARASTPSTSTR